MGFVLTTLAVTYGVGLMLSVKEDGDKYTWDYKWPYTLFLKWLHKERQD